MDASLRSGILIFASGSLTGDRGGRSAVDLALKSRRDLVAEKVIGIVTDYRNGTVAYRAEKHDIPCFYFPRCTTQVKYKLAYNRLIYTHRPRLVVFCGWKKKVFNIFNQTETINVHRGLIVDGKKVSYYKAAERAVDRWLKSRGGELETSLTINFVNGPTVDDGPPIFTQKLPVLLRREGRINRETIIEMVQCALREAQQQYLYQVINHVLFGQVYWGGTASHEVLVPASYHIQTDPNLAMSKSNSQLYPYETAGCFGSYDRMNYGDAY